MDDEYDSLIQQLRGKPREPEPERDDGVRINDLIDQLRGRPTRFQKLEEARKAEEGQDRPAEFLARRSIPFASTIISYALDEDERRAAQRFEAGQPLEWDYPKIARMEARMKAEQNGGLGRKVGSALAHIPAIVGEMAAGGGAVGKVARLAPAARGVVPTVAGMAARTAAVTAAAPSMYVEDARHRAQEGGGQAIDPENLLPAFAHGAVQTAILGRLGKPVGGVPTAAGRLATRTGVGLAESEAASAVAKLSGLTTKYGTLTELAKGDGDWKDAVAHGLTFAVFAGLHAKGDAAAKERAQLDAMEQFQHRVRYLGEKGYSKERAGAELKVEWGKLAEAAAKPPEPVATPEKVPAQSPTAWKMREVGRGTDNAGEYIVYESDQPGRPTFTVRVPPKSPGTAPMPEKVPAQSSTAPEIVAPERSGAVESAPEAPKPVRFKTAMGSTYEIHEDGTTTRNKADHSAAGHDATDQGAKERSHRTVYVQDNAAALSTAGMEGAKKPRVVIKDGKATLITWNEKEGKWGSAPSGRDIPISDTPQVGWHPLELWNKTGEFSDAESYRSMHAGNKIVEVGEPPKPAAAELKAASEAVPEETPEQYRAKLRARITDQGRDPARIERLARRSKAASPEEWDSYVAENEWKLTTAERRLAHEVVRENAAKLEQEKAEIAQRKAQVDAERKAMAGRSGRRKVAPASPVDEKLADFAARQAERKEAKRAAEAAPPVEAPPPEAAPESAPRAIYDRVRADAKAETPIDALTAEIDASLAGKSKGQLVADADAMEIVGTKNRSKEWIAQQIKQKIIDQRSSIQRGLMAEAAPPETPPEAAPPPPAEKPKAAPTPSNIAGLEEAAKKGGISLDKVRRRVKSAEMSGGEEAVAMLFSGDGPAALLARELGRVRSGMSNAEKSAMEAEWDFQLGPEKAKERLDGTLANRNNRATPEWAREAMDAYINRMRELMTEPPPEAMSEPGKDAERIPPVERPEPPPEEPNRMGILPPGSELLQRGLDAIMPRDAGPEPAVQIDTTNRVPRLAPYEELKQTASAPRGMGKAPILSRLFDPRSSAREPVDQAIIARAYSIHQGESLATLEAFRQKGATELFPVDRKTGAMTLTDGGPGYLSDVIEAEMRRPGSQPLTDAQRNWIETQWKPLLESAQEWMRAEDVKDVDALRPDHFPRNVIGKRAIEVKVDRYSRNTQERLYESEAKGANSEDGIIYDPDVASRVAKFLQGVYKAVADARLAKDAALEGKTPAERFERMTAERADELAALPEDAREAMLAEIRERSQYPVLGREGRVDMPLFAGKIFPKEVADKLNRAYGETAHQWVRTLEKWNQRSKAVVLTADMSGPFVQGLAMMYSNPFRWARAAAKSYQSLFDAEVLSREVAKPENAVAANEWVQLGGTLGQLQDFLSGTKDPAVTRIPILGRIIKSTGRAYGVFLDLAKLEMWKAHRESTPPEQRAAAVEAIESSLLMGRTEQIGVHPGAAIGERLVFLAPSYYRGAVGLVSTMFQKGVAGKVARKAIASYATGVTLTSVAGMIAAGLSWDEIQERLNPAKGKFLKVPVKINGQTNEVGFGNVLTGFVRLLGEAAEFHQSDSPIDTGAQANPYLRFLRGKTAFVPGLALDLFIGEDHMGERLGPGQAVANRFEPIVVQQLLQGDGKTIDNAPSALFTFFGMQAYQQGEGDAYRKRMNETATEMHGRAYDRLTFPEQHKVMRKMEATGQTKKAAATPQQLERAFAEQVARQKRLTAAVSEESRKKLNEFGKTVPGYNRSLEISGTTVPLTNEQADRYEKLLAEEYERTISNWKVAGMRVSNPARREEYMKETLTAAKERAKRRLVGEYSKARSVP